MTHANDVPSTTLSGWIGFSFFVVTLVAVLVVAVPLTAAQYTITHFEVTEQSKLDALEAIIPMFEAEFPQYTVDVIHASFNDYYAKLTSMIAAGIAPDVTPLGFYIPRGMAADLRPLMERDGWQPDAISSQFINARPRWHGPNGELYALPYGFAVPVTMYNKNMLNESGIAEPSHDWHSDDWNWDEWVSALRRTTRYGADGSAVGQYGLADFNPWDIIYPIFGGRIQSEDFTQFIGNSPEGVEGLQAIYDLIHVYGVWPAVTREASFRMGTGAFQVTGSHALFNFGVFDVGFDYDIAPTPKARERATYFYVDPMDISANSGNIDAAWEWVKFLLRPDIMKIFVVGGHGKIPSSQELIPWFSDGADGLLPTDLSARLLLEGLDYDASPYAPDGKILSLMTAEVWNEVLKGGEDPAILLERIVPSVQAELDLLYGGN